MTDPCETFDVAVIGGGSAGLAAAVSALEQTFQRGLVWATSQYISFARLDDMVTLDVAAAQAMSPEDRAAMVRGMVEGLEQRLATDGADIEGWLRLMRAWNVLGEADKAKAAAGQARSHFATDDGALARIDTLARELGLGS